MAIDSKHGKTSSQSSSFYFQTELMAHLPFNKKNLNKSLREFEGSELMEKGWWGILKKMENNNSIDKMELVRDYEMGELHVWARADWWLVIDFNLKKVNNLVILLFIFFTCTFLNIVKLRIVSSLFLFYLALSSYQIQRFPHFGSQPAPHSVLGLKGKQ